MEAAMSRRDPAMSAEHDLLLAHEGEVVAHGMLYPEHNTADLVADGNWILDRNRTLSIAIKRTRDDGHAVMPATVIETLVRCYGMQLIDAGRVVMEAMDKHTHSNVDTIRLWAEQLREAAIKRRITEAWSEGHAEALQGFTDRTGERIEAIADLQREIIAGAKRDMTPAEEIAAYIEAVRNPDTRPRLTTGFRRLLRVGSSSCRPARRWERAPSP
jgi:hypothetical protein